MPFEAEPAIEGTLVVAPGVVLFWQGAGNRAGVPVLHLHGGPGSGSSGRFSRRQDPALHFSVSFDQRGCGRSTPRATEPGALEHNTTPHLVTDIELLRVHLGIEAWIVVGGSWGTTLALSYAQAHPHRVLGLVLAAVTTTSTREVEWITEDMGRIFPEEWDVFASAVERKDRERIVDAYARVLATGDAASKLAAAHAWCRWEDVHVSVTTGLHADLSGQDDEFQLLFATLVTHYWAAAGFGGDDILPRMSRLAAIPGTLIHGRQDVSGPTETAWRLHQAWPGSVLHVVEEGHGGPEMTAHLEAAIARISADWRTRSGNPLP